MLNLLGYLDPGTGSVIVQAVIGVGVGAGILIKAYWVKIMSLFGGKSEKSDDFRSKSKTHNQSAKDDE